MATYFGYNVIGIQINNYLGNESITNKNTVVQYSCPGSGNQNVVELSAYCAQPSSSGNIRLALYNADLTSLVCQGSAISAVGVSASWYGHMSQVALTPNPATIIAGVEYRLVVSFDNDLTSSYYNYFSPTRGLTKAVNYTGGFPTDASGSWVDADPGETCIRCGVEAAAGAVAPTSALRGPLFGPLGGPM